MVGGAPPCRHGPGDVERLVAPREVAVHEVEGDGVLVVLQLPGESVGQSGEPPHPHREVLSLNKARGEESSV